MDGTDLVALVGALAWTGDQPSLVSRADHRFHLIANLPATEGPINAGPQLGMRPV